MQDNTIFLIFTNIYTKIKFIIYHNKSLEANNYFSSINSRFEGPLIILAAYITSKILLHSFPRVDMIHVRDRCVFLDFGAAGYLFLESLPTSFRRTAIRAMLLSSLKLFRYIKKQNKYCCWRMTSTHIIIISIFSRCIFSVLHFHTIVNFKIKKKRPQINEIRSVI